MNKTRRNCIFEIIAMSLMFIIGLSLAFNYAALSYEATPLRLVWIVCVIGMMYTFGARK